MTGAQDDVAAAEGWFVEHGLPYFVDDVRAGVARGLGRGRLVGVLGAAVVLGIVGGCGVGAGLGAAAGLGGGLTVAGIVAAAYAVATLRAWLIVGWAVRRTLRSFGLVLPLVTRALPLLLLFITFLFINAEVWQVAASLDGGVLWVAVLLFAAIAVGFLLTRLPEELDTVDAGLRGLERVNLLLVLLVAQAVQVLLLALAVFAFFILFGVVAMEPSVVSQWTGGALHAPDGPVGDWLGDRLSLELLRVSTFLAAFSGLYFTVYAVTDELYRKQFFTVVIRELEQAVEARAAYRSLRDGDDA
ncbi:hypothetical protein RB608_11540 [Nocardioides sp. LHD-245]|uniref:hypothetical protein n=1 Tax=Nocardioides sp. LHD-245 TaxID=3051387 RepID=UPI0027E0C671|nr:hypothetical protein [Nocardioides sp. LHD-245]